MNLERQPRNPSTKPKLYKSGYDCKTTVLIKLPPLILLKWGLVNWEDDPGKAVENNTRCFDALGLLEEELDVCRREQRWALG